MRSTLRLTIAIGCLAGALYLTVRGIPDPGPDPFHMRVEAADVQRARVHFLARVGRDPTQTELRREVDERVRREVLYRHARTHGAVGDEADVRAAMWDRIALLGWADAAASPIDGETVEAFVSLRADRYGELAPAAARSRAIADLRAEMAASAADLRYHEVAGRFRITYGRAASQELLAQ